MGLLRPARASAPNGTMICRGHGVPEIVTPALRTLNVNMTGLAKIEMDFSQNGDIWLG